MVACAAGRGRSAAKKSEPWGEFASLLRIVAHPIRLKILSELSGGARCVMDLNELLPVSQPILSQHMAALRNAGIVSNYARGSLRCYYLTRPELTVKLLEALRSSPPARVRPRDEVLGEVDSRKPSS